MVDRVDDGMAATDVLIVNRDGTVLSINESASMLRGANAHDLVGTPCWKLMGLRYPDGTAFCGPTCPIREELDSAASERTSRLIREREAGQLEEIDLVTLPLASANRRTSLILHVVVPATPSTESRCAVPRAGDWKSLSEAAVASTVRQARTWPVNLSRASAQAASNTDLGKLTGREREVLDLLSNGYNTRSIADRLYISPVTVKHHVQHILGKLGVHRRVDAILAWIRGHESDGVQENASRKATALRTRAGGRKPPP